MITRETVKRIESLKKLRDSIPICHDNFDKLIIDLEKKKENLLKLKL